MNIKAIFKKIEEKENKRLLKIMPLSIGAMCMMELGFKPYKYTYGRKVRGVYIYPHNDNKKVFLSLETFKGDHTDEEMQKIVANLIKNVA